MNSKYNNLKNLKVPKKTKEKKLPREAKREWQN